VNGHVIFGQSFTRQKKRTILKVLATLLLVLILAGCASLMQNLSGGENAKKFQEAKNAYEQRKFKEAYTEYRALAESATDPRLAEQSKFNAAYILVDNKNPDKDYIRAAREFEEFMIRYPRSARAGEAGSWLEILRQFERSRTNELLHQVDDLTKRVDDLARNLRAAQSENAEVNKERGMLLIERSRLLKKVDDLLNDKDDLLKEKAMLIKEREGLTKKIDMLSRDKDALVIAKEKLEKSLNDLTMVDVKMEKQRKKIKKEGK
jgi:outer membrane murein-binding lipoprotein Lpp